MKMPAHKSATEKVRQERVTKLENPTVDEGLRRALLNARAGETWHAQDDERRHQYRGQNPGVGRDQVPDAWLRPRFLVAFDRLDDIQQQPDGR